MEFHGKDRFLFMARATLGEQAAARFLLQFWALALLLGFVLLLVPEPKRHPLVSADGWEVTTGFDRTPVPSGNPLSSEILRSKETGYSRS
jgi:hypothetical protein